MRTYLSLVLGSILVAGVAGCGSTAAPAGSQGCTTNAECPAGDTCLGDHHCWPAGTVLECKPACTGRTHCDPATGTCAACLADADCAAGELCVGRTCKAGCSAAHPGCVADAGSCDVDLGVCRGCLADAECPKEAPRCEAATERCVACLPDKDNCGVGTYCAMANGAYACVAGCKTAADCGVDGGGGMIECCNHACANLAGDKANCGACGMACNGGSCCGAKCIDPTTDLKNCGACGKVCSPANATGQCAAGACTAQCTMGFADCNKDVGDGCETATTADVANCGGCNIKCAVPANGSPVCNVGHCDLVCSANFANCDIDPSNGCETNLLVDVNNCGACAGKCPTPPNGVSACFAGTCGLGGCNPGFKDCDNNPADGCEVNTGNDINNCGACGNACMNLPNAITACANGVCGVAGCNPNFADCDKNVNNGCEASLLSDTNNCGGCGIVCPAVANGSPICAAGNCGIGACNANFRDCDGVAGNGCEVSLLTDKNNCGQCGKVCANSCANGACVNCNSNVLVLGNAGDQVLVNALNGAGMTATLFNNSSTYAANPPAANFGAVLVLVGNDYGSDMPAGGQTAIVNAAKGTTGVVFIEWSAYQLTTGHFQTLAPLLLLARTGGNTSTLTFTATNANHPVWAGLPNSFVTVSSLGANTGNTLTNGGASIANCTECAGAGVVVRDNGLGRVVQIAHAGIYNGVPTWGDANVVKLMINATQWATRCK